MFGAEPASFFDTGFSIKQSIKRLARLQARQNLSITHTEV